jgi:hypothetical protein
MELQQKLDKKSMEEVSSKAEVERLTSAYNDLQKDFEKVFSCFSTPTFLVTKGIA